MTRKHVWDYFENTDAPYVVEPHPDGDWALRLAHAPNTKTIQKFISKEDAVSEARRLFVVAAGKSRPGVLIRNKDGTFGRFEPNQGWWARKMGYLGA